MIKEFSIKYKEEFTRFDMVSKIEHFGNRELNIKNLDIPLFFKMQFDKIGTIKLKKQKNFYDQDFLDTSTSEGWFIVSDKFKTIFQDKLKGYWYDTNQKGYHLFLLHNLIEGLDLNKTYIYYKDNKNIQEYPSSYEYIENITFNDNIKNEYLLKIPELFSLKLCTSKFERLVKKYNITGLKFSNLDIYYSDTKEAYNERCIGKFKQESFIRKLCLYNEKNNTNLNLGEYRKIWVKYMDDESLLYVPWL